MAETEDSLTARNRINQRNFRARRQNYIKDLEERLRKYENDGVQATIEIQTAARQVTEQNVKLRTLLSSRFGMNDQEIDSYIGSSHQTIPPALRPVTSSHLSPKTLLDHKPLLASHPEMLSPPISESSLLSPALGLVSLHHLQEQSGAQSDVLHVTKKQRLEHLPTTTSGATTSLKSTVNQAAYQSWSQSFSLNPEPEQDTLSESSNPQTPADVIDPILRQSYVTQHTPYHLPRQRSSVSSNNSNTTTLTRPFLTTCQSPNSTSTASQSNKRQSYQIPHQSKPVKMDPGDKDNRPQPGIKRSGDDTTSCEDAARIIASMRGGSDGDDRPEHILLELGCRIGAEGKLEGIGRNGSSPCEVKNLNVFQLMDVDRMG